MGLPTLSDVCKLNRSINGGPWCRITTKTGQDTESLRFSMNGVPWVGVAQENASYTFKYYDSASWTGKPLKYHNGSSWVEKPLKHHNGSTWV